MAHFSDSLGASRRLRAREGIFKCIEMRAYYLQANGFLSPLPGHFRLKRRGIEERWVL